MKTEGQHLVAAWEKTTRLGHGVLVIRMEDGSFVGHEYDDLPVTLMKYVKKYRMSLEYIGCGFRVLLRPAAGRKQKEKK